MHRLQKVHIGWALFRNLSVCFMLHLPVVSLQTSSLLLNSTELKIPSSLSPERLEDIAHLLPSLGATFLLGLSPSQLLAALPALRAVSFSPAQVERCTRRRDFTGCRTWQDRKNSMRYGEPLFNTGSQSRFVN